MTDIGVTLYTTLLPHHQTHQRIVPLLIMYSGMPFPYLAFKMLC